MSRRKRKKTSINKQTSYHKICNKCGTENTFRATVCVKCNSSRFAPSWVDAKRLVNRQVAVEVTNTDEKFGAVQKRITLTKWWPGGNATFHIPNPEQWTIIQNIINNDLSLLLGWQTKREIISKVKESTKDEGKLQKDIAEMVKQYPGFLKQIASTIDTLKIAGEDFDQIADVFGHLAKLLMSAGTGFKEAFLKLLNRLPKQGQNAISELEKLLHTWTLHQITGVTQQVKSRIETIELFEKQIHNDRTFEIRGDTSIHRILEKAMWLIDERYWLLQSNASLLKFIGDEIEKEDRKKHGKKRPDFVCGTVGDKLIIIEIKRPSHTLEIEDLNQLETYLTIAEKYKTYRTFEAILIGNKKSDDLIKRQKHRSSHFQVLTYSDLLDDTKHRYRKYLETIEKDENGE